MRIEYHFQSRLLSISIQWNFACITAVALDPIEEWIAWLIEKILFFDVGSCSIFNPCGVKLTILLEEIVFPDEPLFTNMALLIEFIMVFPNILLLEESDFTLIPSQKY